MCVCLCSTTNFHGISQREINKLKYPLNKKNFFFAELCVPLFAIILFGEDTLSYIFHCDLCISDSAVMFLHDNIQIYRSKTGPKCNTNGDSATMFSHYHIIYKCTGVS